MEPTRPCCGFDLPHASSGAPEASTTNYLDLLSTNRYLRPAVQGQDTAAMGRTGRAASEAGQSSRWLSPCESESASDGGLRCSPGKGLSRSDDAHSCPWLSEALRPFAARLRPQRGPWWGMQRARPARTTYLGAHRRWPPARAIGEGCPRSLLALLASLHGRRGSTPFWARLQSATAGRI
jgi:hypothetical protein